MTPLKENIRYYMHLKNIKNDSALLRYIACELGFIKRKDQDSFVRAQKANFSKMLNGKRQLSYDFIIPLEKIFGVPFAKIVEPNAYKLPIDKENVPYSKGFRYYAYLDDPELYEKELFKLLATTKEDNFCSTDEFHKTFLDYVVEYNSVNGIRFLKEKYNLKLDRFDNHFTCDLGLVFFLTDKSIELARMISNMNDVKLFNDIYDSRRMMASNGYYLDITIFNRDDFAEIILENEGLFESLFDSIQYSYEYGPLGKKRHNKESMDFVSINPVINTCLRFGLSKLEKYRTQVVKILKFGLTHNRETFLKMKGKSYQYTVTECGALYNYTEDIILDVIVQSKIDITNDKEIDEMINNLPKLSNY